MNDFPRVTTDGACVSNSPWACDYSRDANGFVSYRLNPSHPNDRSRPYEGQAVADCMGDNFVLFQNATFTDPDKFVAFSRFLGRLRDGRSSNLALTYCAANGPDTVALNGNAIPLEDLRRALNEPEAARYLDQATLTNLKATVDRRIDLMNDKSNPHRTTSYLGIAVGGISALTLLGATLFNLRRGRVDQAAQGARVVVEQVVIITADAAEAAAARKAQSAGGITVRTVGGTGEGMNSLIPALGFTPTHDRNWVEVLNDDYATPALMSIGTFYEDLLAGSPEHHGWDAAGRYALGALGVVGLGAAVYFGAPALVAAGEAIAAYAATSASASAAITLIGGMIACDVGEAILHKLPDAFSEAAHILSSWMS